MLPGLPHLQVMVGLIVISKLGKVFSVLTWAYLTVLVAFIAPKLCVWE